MQIAAVVFVFFSLASLATARSPTLLKEWRGEDFAPKYGAFLMEMHFRDIALSQEDNKMMTADVQIELNNMLRKRTYRFNQQLGTDEQVWRTQSGKYFLRKLRVVDKEGQVRIWQPKKKRNFIVKRRHLSNLGVWHLSPVGSSELAVKIRMKDRKKLNFRRAGNTPPLIAIINGFTSLVQRRFASRANLDDTAQARAFVGVTREISMFYKLNLFKHNRHAPVINKVLQADDTTLRRCYMDQLELNQRLRGRVVFRFILSRQTGSIAKLRQIGGSIRSPRMIKCLYFELSQLQFPVPRTMVGELDYSFDVK